MTFERFYKSALRTLVSLQYYQENYERQTEAFRQIGMSRYAEIGFALDRIIAEEIPEHGMDFEDYAINAPVGSKREADQSS